MIKNLIKKIFYRLKLDLKRLNVESNASYQIYKSLKYFDVDLILDIGANTGQFASELFSVGYRGRIISFEPLPNAHKSLIENAQYYENWSVYPRTAIGNTEGNVEINISSNSVSSSILPMLNTHLEAAKESEYVSKALAKITTLDKVVGDLRLDNKSFFIKIDTQGFEWQVMDGAVQALSLAKGVLCELSLTPLYEGQHLWLETIERLGNLGFKLWAIQSGFTNINTGRTLQIDAIFFKDI
jgi:FkbM family methyltransferase